MNEPLMNEANQLGASSKNTAKLPLSLQHRPGGFNRCPRRSPSLLVTIFHLGLGLPPRAQDDDHRLTGDAMTTEAKRRYLPTPSLS